MLRYYIFLFITLFSTLEISAQSLVVRGNVKDEMGSPLFGATVAEIDANNRILSGAITDVNGNYVIKMSSPSSRIQFSFISYKTITMEVNGRSTIDIQLQPDAALLNAVEIVADRSSSSITGISEQSRAGAVAKLDMNTVKDEALSDASDALQGQIAGLDIVSSGTPGGSANIVIRGLSTIGDATPLIVLDGIPQENFDDDFDFSTAETEDFSALLSIPTQDIRAIRVLKDATECAVWGSRGANGVIEIDTHQGQKGKTKFTYSYKYNFSELAKQIPMLNGDEYIMLQQEMLFNRYGLVDYDDEIALDPTYLDYYNYSQNTNWYDEVTQNGFVKENSLKVEGGGDKTNYYISVNLYNEEGQILNETLDRINTRVNLSYKISDKINLTTRFSYLNSLKGGNWQLNNNYSVSKMTYLKAPNMSVYEYDNDGNLTGDFFNPIENYQGNGVTYSNPVAVVNYSKDDTETNQLNTDFILRYNMSKHLVWQQTVSMLNNGAKRNIFLPYNAIGDEWNESNNNYTKELNTTNNTLTTRTLLNAKLPHLGKHSVESSFMFETYSKTTKSMQTATELNMSFFIDDPAAGSIVDGISSSYTKQTTLGLLGSLAYNYDYKYYLTAHLRADASSKFGVNNRWGYFPSIGVKWLMAKESFMQTIPFIGRSNLSVSWGRTGNVKNSIKAYTRHGIYDDGAYYLGSSSVIPSQVQLDNLKWETKEEVSTSWDLGLLKNNRLSLLLEYYNKRTYDMLWSNYSIPSSSGYSTLDAYNGGAIRNVGYEISATMRDVIKVRDFSLLLRFNVNKNTNWFEEFPDNQQLTQNGDVLTNLAYPLKAQLDKPIGSIFGVRYLGVYSRDEDAVATNADGSTKLDAYGEPIPMVFTDGTRFRGGDAKYDDVNHDGIIDMNDVVFLGDSNPKLTGGFGASASYKRFRLSAQFIFRYGFNVVNYVAMDSESMTNKNNQSKATLYRWRRQGDDFDGMIPRAYYGHKFNSLGSDRYVEDGTFLKFNSLSMSYTMGNKGKEMFNINNFKISANVRKIHTWTNYSGQNPEITTSMTNAFWVAKDNGKTTPPRVYSITLSVTL